MRLLVRGTALLQFLALAGLWFLSHDTRFLLAGVAIVCLVEVGLLLRARAGRPAASGERSRISAAHVSYGEQDGAVTVTFTGENDGRASAPYVLLSRVLRSGQAGADAADGPYLELSDRQWSVYGGIQEAYLSPQRLCLTLNRRGSEVLGAETVSVALRYPRHQRQLERALSRIVRGVPFTSERSAAAHTDDVLSDIAA